MRGSRSKNFTNTLPITRGPRQLAALSRISPISLIKPPQYDERSGRAESLPMATPPSISSAIHCGHSLSGRTRISTLRLVEIDQSQGWYPCRSVQSLICRRWTALSSRATRVCEGDISSRVVRTQKAVSAYFTSEQILYFSFAGKYCAGSITRAPNETDKLAVQGKCATPTSGRRSGVKSRDWSFPPRPALSVDVHVKYINHGEQMLRFFSIWNHHKCLGYIFLIYLITYVMGLRPLYVFLFFQCEIVIIRQNLTSTDGRLWRIKTIPALKGLAPCDMTMSSVIGRVMRTTLLVRTSIWSIWNPESCAALAKSSHSAIA